MLFCCCTSVKLGFNTPEGLQPIYEMKLKYLCMGAIVFEHQVQKCTYRNCILRQIFASQASSFISRLLILPLFFIPHSMLLLHYLLTASMWFWIHIKASANVPRHRCKQRSQRAVQISSSEHGTTEHRLQHSSVMLWFMAVPTGMYFQPTEWGMYGKRTELPPKGEGKGTCITYMGV